MMVQLFIALAAGCASALMFASVISGALLSLVLFYLAPLPLMVAALGWEPVVAPVLQLRPGTVACPPRCEAVLVTRLPASTSSTVQPATSFAKRWSTS